MARCEERDSEGKMNNKEVFLEKGMYIAKMERIEKGGDRGRERESKNQTVKDAQTYFHIYFD